MQFVTEHRQRVLLPSHCTSSLNFEEASIVGHAKERIRQLWLDLDLVHNLVPEADDVSILMGKAPAQGSVAKRKGNQAAHPNFMAGADIDVLATMTRVIESKRSVSPSMSGVFKLFGIPMRAVKKLRPRDIKRLTENMIGLETKGVFSIHRKYGAMRQSTNELPAAVNEVDSGLEQAIRKNSIKVFKSVAKGAVTALEGFGLLRSNIIKYFSNAILNIKMTLSLGREYLDLKAHVQTLQDGDLDPTIQKELSQSLQKLSAIRKQLKITKKVGVGSITDRNIQARLPVLEGHIRICEEQLRGTMLLELEKFRPLTPEQKMDLFSFISIEHGEKVT